MFDELSGLAAAAQTGSGGEFEILAPFTGRALASIPQWRGAEVERAAERARRSQPAWAQAGVEQRCSVLSRFVHLLRSHRDQLLDVLQYETGKARIDALFELGEAVLGAGYHLRSAPGLLAPRKHRGALPLLTKVRQLPQAKGTVAVIVPWNFPVALAVIDAVPALLAGNAVLLKPDNQTALSALLLQRLTAEAGLPPGLFQVVLGEPAQVGDPLLDAADYVAFTGSTASGRRIAASAGQRLIGCSLELGGKNPMIVLADADLGRAARAVRRGSFANAGQLCMTAERLYVHNSVYDEFVDRVVDQVSAIRLGATFGFTADMGSLTTPAALARTGDVLAEACAAGATVLAGGGARPDLGPLFHEPTVVADVPLNARLHREEVFGPVVAIHPFEDIDEAVTLANDSEYGLTASVWTRDRRLGEQVAARIRSGGVGVNDCYTAAFGAHSAPMGGMKASGIGRRHGPDGLLRYTESQTVAVQYGAGIDERLGLPRTWHARVVGAGLDVLARSRHGR